MTHDRDEALFRDTIRAARAQTPQVGEDVLARVMADADRVRDARAARRGQRRTAPGGWPALGAMTVAGVAGLWLGLVPPAGLSALALDAQTVRVPLLGADILAELEQTP